MHLEELGLQILLFPFPNYGPMLGIGTQWTVMYIYVYPSNHFLRFLVV
ncbi:hypothetical protein BCAH1134_C0381 (plasmid) [Bacillus cereus AH1134]|nr:hypothetical protein BCAH1134_C0381 [Bacillus cereus AH1134]